MVFACRQGCDVLCCVHADKGLISNVLCCVRADKGVMCVCADKVVMYCAVCVQTRV